MLIYQHFTLFLLLIIMVIKTCFSTYLKIMVVVQLNELGCKFL